MLICYDMVFPEAARCLALGGADVVFHPTLGGAAIGDDDISLAAFRTRAAENFVYLVVAMRGHGSMIISPQGKVLATADEPDGLAIADIDPSGGREGGDAFNTQADMRGRLFRERVPGAYGILDRPEPARARQGAVERDPGRGHPHHGDRADHRRGAVQGGRGPGPGGQDRGGDPALRAALRGVPHLLDRPGRPGAAEEAPPAGTVSIAGSPLIRGGNPQCGRQSDRRKITAVVIRRGSSSMERGGTWFPWT